MGGLELNDVKTKATPHLIRNFLETVVNPQFIHIPLHSSLYRVHILLDDSLSPPHQFQLAILTTFSLI